MKCRFCKTSLRHSFIDLGMSPLSNSYLKQADLQNMEPFYPLHVFVCEECYLVQLAEFETPDQIFSDYAYFSSYSDIWLDHARVYVEHMNVRFAFDKHSLVVEVASNDGYLLQFFKERGIPVLGVEPAENVANVAKKEKGIPTIVEFFGTKVATELANGGKKADLFVGNNVLAHVPDLNDFVAGIKILLKPRGIITIEFPHLLQLINSNQYDTIYHEHFSYFSFLTALRVFAKHDLSIFDVEELPTHGGSLRIYACHSEDTSKPISDRVNILRESEEKAGLARLKFYSGFSERIKETKRELLAFLITAKEKNKSIVGYGAPAKGNTLLNYCGIRSDFIDYTVDRSPHKQGMFLPGTHIPVYPPDKIRQTKPDYLLVLPWNIKDEIMDQMAFIREWGCRFVVPIPEVQILA